jgi:phosphoglycolate phosphatase-like HAD superfamily hydrolase
MSCLAYQLIIFDSDGTLAGTLPWMRTVFNELALTHGFKQVDPEDHERMHDLHGMELLRALELPLWNVLRVLRDLRTDGGAGGELRPVSGNHGRPAATRRPRIATGSRQLAI